MKKKTSRLFLKFLTSSMALTLVATTYSTSQASSFTDVSTSDWYYNYINDMANENFVSGMTEDTYAPLESLSVAAFSTMISNGFYGETLATEKEQATGDWWQPYLLACFNRSGLVGTIASDTNNWSAVANNSINRYDMAVMISNLLSDRGVSAISDTEKTEIIAKFSDDIEETYAQSVATASHYGFISGREDGSFDGSASLNRAEAAVVLSALVKSDLIATEKVSDFTVSTPTTDVPSVTPEGMVTVSFAKVGDTVSTSQVIPAGSTLESLPSFGEYEDHNGAWCVFNGWYYLYSVVDDVVYTTFGEPIYVNEETVFNTDTFLIADYSYKINNPEDGVGLPSCQIAYSPQIGITEILQDGDVLRISEYYKEFKVWGSFNRINSGLSKEDGTIVWTTSNDSVAEVETTYGDTECLIKILDIGETTITARWTENDSWNNTTPISVSESFTLLVEEPKFHDVNLTVLVDGVKYSGGKLDTYGIQVDLADIELTNTQNKDNVSLPYNSPPYENEVTIYTYSGENTMLSNHEVTSVEVQNKSGEILHHYSKEGSDYPKFLTNGSINHPFYMPDEPIDIIVNYSSLG